MCEEEDEDEELITDASGNLIPADESLEGATVNRTNTDQDGAGLGLQASFDGELGRRANRFIVGVAYDESDIGFDASTELGALDSSRRAVAGGVSVGEALTRMRAETSNVGFYI